MSTFICTRQGRFDYEKPWEFVPELEPTLQTMARIQRFNGHGSLPYSVLQHTIAGTEAFTDTWAAKAFFVHDMHEVLTGDFPKPMKNAIPRIAELEEAMERRFRVTFLMDTGVYDDGWTADKHINGRDRAKAMDRLLVALEAQCLGLDDGWSVDYILAYEAARDADPRGLPRIAEVQEQVYRVLTMSEEQALDAARDQARYLGIR